MKTLLLINSSPTLLNSNSRALTEILTRHWQQQFPAGQVIERDIGKNPIPHLLHDSLEPINSPENETFRGVGLETFNLSNTLIAEIKAADLIVLGVPTHNLSFPSTLKAYFDHIAIAGKTWGGVKYGKDKQVVVITTAGSLYHGAEYDFLAPYIKAFLKTIDLENVIFIRAFGLCKTEAIQKNAMTNAENEIKNYVANLCNSSTHISNGCKKYMLKEYDAAIKCFDQAINFQPNHAAAYFYRGDAKFALQQYNEAIKDYLMAIKLDPTQPLFYANLAEAKRQIKDISGSLMDLQTAIKLDNSDHQQIDYPYYRLARNLTKNNLTIYLPLTYDYLAQKAFKGFAKNLNAAQTDSNANLPYTLYYLGRCYEEGCGVDKNLTKANEHYNKANQLVLPTEMLAYKLKRRLHNTAIEASNLPPDKDISDNIDTSAQQTAPSPV